MNPMHAEQRYRSHEEATVPVQTERTSELVRTEYARGPPAVSKPNKNGHTGMPTRKHRYGETIVPTVSRPNRNGHTEMPTREHRYEETTVPTQEIPVSMRAAAGNVGAPSPDLRLSNYGHAKMPSRVQRPTKRWAPGPAL